MRNVIELNQGWQFIKEDVGLPAAMPTDWCTVDLPHTWNAQAAFGRGTCVCGDPGSRTAGDCLREW